jgi:hypothetical protein
MSKISACAAPRPDVLELVETTEPSLSALYPAPTTICLLQAGRTLARVTVSPAEQEGLRGRSPQQLRHTALLHGLEIDDLELIGPLLYLALRRARIWGRTTIAATPPAAGLLGKHLALEPVDGDGELHAQRIDLAIHRAYAASDASGQQLCREHMLPEALAIFARHCRRFHHTAWARAVRGRRLARAQYVATLANTHQYVRFTPRLLARAVAVSEDEALREHFLEHLGGERRHHELIEADLRYLGADVEFVRERMSPAPATMQFMLVQESMVAFYRDPVLFMAAPFVAEGLAASVGPELMGPLLDNIRAWGHDEPQKATRFLRSHVHLDGGDDGHFARTCAVIAGYLRDEAVHQRFLAVMQLAAEAFHRSYDAYVDDLSVFSPPA